MLGGGVYIERGDELCIEVKWFYCFVIFVFYFSVFIFYFYFFIYVVFIVCFL